jgi:hypothetical protein
VSYYKQMRQLSAAQARYDAMEPHDEPDMSERRKAWLDRECAEAEEEYGVARVRQIEREWNKQGALK